MPTFQKLRVRCDSKTYSIALRRKGYTGGKPTCLFPGAPYDRTRHRHRRRNPHTSRLHRAHCHRGAGGAGAQLEEPLAGRAAAAARGHCGRLRLGQKLACAGRSIRRGQPPLPGGAFHLHAPAHFPGRTRYRGRGAARACRPRPAPAARHSRRPFHLRHLHGTAELPASHVLAPRLPRVPQRARERADPERGRRYAHHLFYLRRGILRPFRRGPRLQQRRRLPHLRRHRRCARHRRVHAHRRSQPYPGRGRRGPLAQPHVVAHAPGGSRDGRAHRRALQGSDRCREGHRTARPHGKAPHSVCPQEQRPCHRAGLHLLQRREHREKRAGKGEGREGHGARGEVPVRVGVPRLPRHAAVREGAHVHHRRAQPRPGDGLVAGRAARLDSHRGPVAAGGNAPDVRLHHERDDRAHTKAGAAGAGIPHPRPRQRDAFERRTPARGSHARRAQPHHRRPLRAGRALYRAAPGEHRGAARGHGRPSGRRQLRGDGGSRRGRVAPRESPHRDRPRFGRRRRPRHRPGVGGQRGSEPSQSHRAVFGGNGEGAGAHARRARASFRRRGHRIGDRRHPHRASVGSAHSERASDLRDRRIRLGQDDTRAGKPRRRAEGVTGRHDTARACAVRGRAGHRAGRPGGCHAHRRERALHRGHLLRRAGRFAPRLRRPAERQGAGAESRGVLLQHRIFALPHLRRHGTDLPGRAVPPRRGHPLPRLPRQPLRAGGLRHPNGHRRRRRTVHRRRNGAQRGP